MLQRRACSSKPQSQANTVLQPDMTPRDSPPPPRPPALAARGHKWLIRVPPNAVCRLHRCSSTLAPGRKYGSPLTNSDDEDRRSPHRALRGVRLNYPRPHAKVGRPGLTVTSEKHCETGGRGQCRRYPSEAGKQAFCARRDWRPTDPLPLRRESLGGHHTQTLGPSNVKRIPKLAEPGANLIECNPCYCSTWCDDSAARPPSTDDRIPQTDSGQGTDKKRTTEDNSWTTRQQRPTVTDNDRQRPTTTKDNPRPKTYDHDLRRTTPDHGPRHTAHDRRLRPTTDNDRRPPSMTDDERPMTDDERLTDDRWPTTGP